MKRDMDLIRKILLEVEKQGLKGVRWPTEKTIPGYENEKVRYHLKLLYQKNLIDISKYTADEWKILGLTFEGHDFLDAAKNDEVWNKAKEKAQEKGYELPFDLLKDILITFMKSELL